MLQSESRRIDEHEYVCTTFPARKGFKLQARLARFIAPLLSGVGFKMGDSLAESDLKFDGAQVVNTLLTQLDDDLIMRLVLDLLETTYRDGKPITGEAFDDAYAGNYGELFKALTFTVEANGFFGLGRAGGGLTNLLKQVKFPASSTTASPPNGPSGAS